MRVISGSARGRKLKAPEGLTTRPTTDRIKESLFNIIAPDLFECRFLDLFSGSGSMGIEAVSRGAQKAVLVDSDRNSINVIRDNVTATGFQGKTEIMGCDVSSAIATLGNRKEKFDIIFMDPPYNKGLIDKTLRLIVKANLLADNGYIIAEQSQEDSTPDIPDLEVFRVKDYKITKMTFLSKPMAEEQLED